MHTWVLHRAAGTLPGTGRVRRLLQFTWVQAVAILFWSVAASAIQQPDRLQSTPGSYANPPGGQAASPAQVLDNLPYVPGRLIVKMKSSVTACIDCLVEQGQPLAPAVGSQHLDDLNRAHGLRRVLPFRKRDGAVKSLAERRRLQHARRQSMLARAAGRFGPGRGAQSLPDFASTYVFELSPWKDMEAVAREYASDPAVAYAEPDRKAKVLLTPNDPFFSSAGAWHQPFDDLWGLKLISAPAAWDVARGAGVVVAVIDTGLDNSHPDIAANVWVNSGEVPGNGIDDDGNGYVDDENGWNFVDDNSGIFDDHGHGTHVSGTIAAVGQNGVGVIGVAWESKIMALKGLSASGSGSAQGLAQAILYAAENGADVINASWGGVGVSQVIDDAITVADAAGVVFVAAAGNSNLDVESNQFGVFFPAANPHAITVSAFDHLDQRAFFSNFGTKIDVAAPGGGDTDPHSAFDPFRSILSLRSSGAGSDMTGNGNLVISGNYVRQAGTSMAAPHVTGAAALVLSAHASYTPEQVRQALRVGADDVRSPGFDLESGYGRINVARSVALDALAARITSPAGGFVASGTEVSFTGSATGAGFASYTLEYGSGALPTAWTPFAGPFNTSVDNGPLATWDISNVPDATYVVRLRAVNTSAGGFEDRVRLTLDHLVLAEPASNTIRKPVGPLEIRGTAAGGGFQRYRVEWRLTTADFVTGGWTSSGMALSSDGTSPITDGVLATFDTGLITQNSDLDFRVVITRTGGYDIAEEVRHVILDPTLRAGWPQQIDGLPDFNWRLMDHLTVADLDGDGTKEILAAYGDMVYVFRPDGTPMPGWPQLLNGTTADVPFTRRAPAAADLDGDGRLEVVVADSDAPFTWTAFGDIYIWHADGTPMAGWPKKFNRAYALDPNASYGGGGPRGDFVLSDINGDGRREIIAVVGPALYVIDPVSGTLLPGWPQTWPLVWPCIGGDDCFEDAVAVGDVDRDGKKEIAVITEDLSSGHDSNARTLLLYRANGTIMPNFPKRVSRLLYGKPNGRLDGYVNVPIMADINGDGDLEIIAMTNTMKVRAFHHTGRVASLHPGKAKGTTYRSCFPVTRFPPILEPPTAGDLDGDGRAEVLISSHTKSWKWKPAGPNRSTFTICPGNVRNGVDYINALSGPKQSRPAGWPVALAYPSGDSSYGPGPVAIGDIDGDLRPDIVSASGICGYWDRSFGMAGHRCFTVNAYDALGNRLPGFPKSTPGPGSTNGVTPAIADLAGDGLKEIVWVDFFGHILVWNVAGTPAPEKMQWPMFRHDPGHTGALVSNP